MADYCCTHSTQELDDVHRLLPPEILKDIGVADPAERRRLAAVEDIARRLAGVLGEATRRAQCAPPSCHRPQRRAFGGRDILAGDSIARRTAAPPFLSSPAAPWQAAMEGRTGNGMVLHPAAAAPRFAPAVASPFLNGARPATIRRRNCGTGVFLPSTVDAVRRTATKTARSPSNDKHVIARADADVNPTRQCVLHQHRRGEEAAIARRQQELQAMAVKMEVRRQYAAIDVHGSCPELGLPQEWTY